MTSRHYKWQARWRFDLAAGQAEHESGLRMRLLRDPGTGAPRVAAENRAETLEALTPKHGGHNAPLMLARLEREALQLLREALAEDARCPPIRTD